MTKSTLLHLRIPFSYFLMPVFLLAALFAPRIEWWRFALAFLIIHFLLYPASNAFNSYYDRDTGSIGGLRNPPAVDAELLPVSLLLDCLAVILGLIVSWQFAIAVLFYGVCSKIYSHSLTRLKKRPVLSWLGTGIVQGGFVFLVANFAIQGKSLFSTPPSNVLYASTIVTMLMLGFYPLTQVYQHDEDGKRGDMTISMLLGIRGTFIVSGLLLALSAAGFCMLLIHNGKVLEALLFALFLSPSAAYLLHYFGLISKDVKLADYDHSMRMNVVAASGMNLFCAVSLLYSN